MPLWLVKLRVHHVAAPRPTNYLYDGMDVDVNVIEEIDNARVARISAHDSHLALFHEWIRATGLVPKRKARACRPVPCPSSKIRFCDDADLTDKPLMCWNLEWMIEPQLERGPFLQSQIVLRKNARQPADRSSGSRPDARALAAAGCCARRST